MREYNTAFTVLLEIEDDVGPDVAATADALIYGLRRLGFETLSSRIVEVDVAKATAFADNELFPEED